jgi:hypothetical protein
VDMDLLIQLTQLIQLTVSVVKIKTALYAIKIRDVVYVKIPSILIHLVDVFNAIKHVRLVMDRLQMTA